jgi:hypothetical protein
MRDDFDSVVADRFTALDDVPVPDTWSRVQFKLLDPTPVPVTGEDATMIDLAAPIATDERREGPKRVVVAALLVAAAVIAIALVAIRNDDPVSPADQPSPTVTVPPTVALRALFDTVDERYVPGTYFVDEVGGSPTPRIFVTVGEGWRNSRDQGAIRNDDIGVITFSRPARVFSDACHNSDGFHPGLATTVDGLVAALSEQGGWVNVTTPTDITINGYRGKTFQRTAPASFTGCTTGGDTGFRSFDDGGRPGGWPYYERGEIETVRVLDVNGTIIMITSRLKLGYQDAAAVAGLATVFDSIRIEQT